MKWSKVRGEFVAKSNEYRSTAWCVNGKWSCEVMDRYHPVARRSGFKIAATAQNYAERALTKYLKAELKRVRSELGVM